MIAAFIGRGMRAVIIYFPCEIRGQHAVKDEENFHAKVVHPTGVLTELIDLINKDDSLAIVVAEPCDLPPGRDSCALGASKRYPIDARNFQNWKPHFFCQISNNMRFSSA